MVERRVASRVAGMDMRIECDDRAHLERLAPSLKQAAVGDVFVFRPVGRGYFFGRVIRTDVRAVGGALSLLVYLFAIESHTRVPPAHLSAKGLLTAPMLTDQQIWSRGYFETVQHRPIARGERLPVHCFKIPGSVPARYVDADGVQLPAGRRPCGIYVSRTYLEVKEVIGRLVR